MMIRLLAASLLALTASVLAQENYGDTIRMRVKVGGENRKVALFLPKSLKRGEMISLLVAIPATAAKAYLEIGQWQKEAFEHRFAVLSADTTTGSKQGWHPSDQLEMQRDMETITLAIEAALKKAKTKRMTIDTTATVITGWSGGAYLALWLGVRRPDLFMGICVRGFPNWYKEFLEFGKLDSHPPKFTTPIFLYRGELDNRRVAKQTEITAKKLQEKGYKNVVYKVIAKMQHESKPEVFLEWYYKLLKDTAKGRADSIKIAAEVATIRAGLREIGFEVPDPVEGAEVPIFPVIVGGAGKALALADHMLEAGVFLLAIRPPTVPEGTSRLRATLMATHTGAQIGRALDALESGAKKLGL